MLTERLSKGPQRDRARGLEEAVGVVEASDRNAEVLQAMGFGNRFTRRLERANTEHIRANERLSDITGGFSTVSRIFRLMLQSGLLGIGAYLTIKGEMTAGAIIACSIAASRALAPLKSLSATGAALRRHARRAIGSMLCFISCHARRTRCRYLRP